MVCLTTTGSRTFASSARTAPRRSRHTAVARTSGRLATVPIAALNSNLALVDSATAVEIAASESRGRTAVTGERSSAHPTSSCSKRSRRRATSPSGASTACPTTRFASGCGSTGASGRGDVSAPGGSRGQSPLFGGGQRLVYLRKGGHPRDQAVLDLVQVHERRRVDLDAAAFPDHSDRREAQSARTSRGSSPRTVAPAPGRDTRPLRGRVSGVRETTPRPGACGRAPCRHPGC